jgi:hypothetical protein
MRDPSNWGRDRAKHVRFRVEMNGPTIMVSGDSVVIMAMLQTSFQLGYKKIRTALL